MTDMERKTFCAALSRYGAQAKNCFGKTITAPTAGPRWTEAKCNGKVFQNCRD